MNNSFLLQIRKFEKQLLLIHSGEDCANVVRKGRGTAKDDRLTSPSRRSSYLSHLSRPEKTLRAV